MKASHIFLFGVIFTTIWQFLYKLVDNEWNFDGAYNYADIFILVCMIVIWFMIDAKLNKTYKVTKWDE